MGTSGGLVARADARHRRALPVRLRGLEAGAAPLIILIALGESIVAVGVGVGARLDVGIAAAAGFGIGLAAALWWIYFDVVALVAARRLERAPPGHEQNEIARDSYSYLHFAMVAGIVLVALGMKKTLGHVAFRYRHVKTINRERLVLGVALLAAVPLATEVASLLALAVVTTVLWAMIAYETRSYGESRIELRREAA